MGFRADYTPIKLFDKLRQPCDNTGKVEQGGRGHTVLLSFGLGEIHSRAGSMCSYSTYLGRKLTYLYRNPQYIPHRYMEHQGSLNTRHNGMLGILVLKLVESTRSEAIISRNLRAVSTLRIIIIMMRALMPAALIFFYSLLRRATWH